MLKFISKEVAMPNQDILNILKLAAPLLVLQLAAIIWAITDIIKRKKTRNLNPVIWIIIVLFFELLGPIAYFLIGRAED